MASDPEKPAKAERAEQIELAAIERLIERLSRRFPDLARDEIVRAKYAQFAGSRIRTFIPTLVERSVRADLAAAERRTGE
jgi:hypothetical protein